MSLGLNYCADDGPHHPAAGAAHRDSRASSTPSSACSRTRRSSRSSASSTSSRRSRPRASIRTGRRRPSATRAMPSRPCSTSSSASACRATRSASSAGSRPARSGDARMATATARLPSAVRPRLDCADRHRREAAVQMIGVHKWYGEFHVLRDINLDVRRGERIVICGPVRLRQVDDDPLHQPARGAPEGPHHRRRHRAHQRPQAHRRDPPRGRHGVPALQPVPAPDHPGELHARADLGEEDAEEGGGGGRDEVPDPRQDPGAGEQVSGPALRRPAAARRHRPLALHEPEDHALRRADLGARSRRWSRRCSTPWSASPRRA